MCLFDTDEVVRTMAKAMGMGEGPAGCKSSPTGSYKGGEREALGSEGIGHGRARSGGEQGGERGRLPAAAQPSAPRKASPHHSALTPAIGLCSFSSVSLL